MRHSLNDREWDLIKGLLPAPSRWGRRERDRRQIFNALLWILRTGAPWRDLPRERYGPWQTVYNRFNKWRAEGVFERIHAKLLQALDEAGQIDWKLWLADGSSVRAARCAAGARGGGRPPGEPPDHALGRSRGGFGTKFHLLCDSKGTPLAAVLTPGQRHESTCFESLMDSVRIPRRWPGRMRMRPDRLAADRAYSIRRIRRWLWKRKTQPVIPQRSTQAGRKGGCRTFDPQAYGLRNSVERCVAWIKECRRVATRFEKLAVNYLAIVKLSFIQRLLRVVFESVL